MLRTEEAAAASDLERAARRTSSTAGRRPPTTRPRRRDGGRGRTCGRTAPAAATSTTTNRSTRRHRPRTTPGRSRRPSPTTAPAAPAPPWASSRRTTDAGYIATDVGCADGTSAADLDEFFRDRMGPVLGHDYQHVYPLGGGALPVAVPGHVHRPARHRRRAGRGGVRPQHRARADRPVLHALPPRARRRHRRRSSRAPVSRRSPGGSGRSAVSWRAIGCPCSGPR